MTETPDTRTLRTHPDHQLRPPFSSAEAVFLIRGGGINSSRTTILDELPDDVYYILCGFGLFIDEPEYYIGKKMSEATGQEILT